MYFDPRPKTSRKDLFLRDRELEELSNLDVPLTLVLGPRRLGKTSLLRVFMDESDMPFIFTDCRSLVVSGTSVSNYHRLLMEQLNGLAKSKSNVLEAVKRIKGLNLFGVELELDNKRSDSFLVESFNALDRWALKENRILYLVFDEAQLFRHFKRNGGLDFNELFSYIYDNLTGLRIILTGSEVGVLEDFIGLDDSSSPLYGRYAKKLYLSRFTRKESEEFLEKGFDEVRMEAPAETIREAVDTLDGIVGWLVFFGRVCIDAKGVDRKSIELTLEKAEIILNDELSNLKRNSTRYISILKAIAFGSKGWKEIKTATEIIENNNLTDTAFNRILNRLIELSYVDIEIGIEGKTYKLVDPVIASVVRKFG
ncbi:MAG: ATP-binding protein [Thermotogaceae bacterium]|jgi:AAA+ ATPase superfamily predicted ATPase|nr:ATP-binding protein [Thermotogaceae bacterium]